MATMMKTMAMLPPTCASSATTKPPCRSSAQVLVRTAEPAAPSSPPPPPAFFCHRGLRLVFFLFVALLWFLLERVPDGGLYWNRVLMVAETGTGG